MSIKKTQKPAREFRPLFDRAMNLIQQRYPDIDGCHSPGGSRIAKCTDRLAIHSQWE